MATVTDVEVANASFPTVRQDLNDILEAIATNFSADAEPSTMYANQFWYETDTNLLKFRNEDNDAWITLAYFDQTNDEWEVRSAVIQAVDSAGVVIKTDEGTTRFSISDAGVVSFQNYSFPTADGSANQVLATDGSGALSFVDQSGGGAVSNMIYNGAMTVSQRGTTFASAANASYTCDRWRFGTGGSSAITVSQSSTAPDGFAYSLKFDVTTAEASLGSGSYARISQRLEGQDLQHLKKGTANALTTTVSFWVRSNKTGTYIVSFDDRDNNRFYSQAYTVDSADTWEKKTITFTGDTSGAFNNDNADSAEIIWFLAAGSAFSGGTLSSGWESRAVTDGNRAAGQVNFVDNTANELYITGVLFETGSSASDYPHRSFGEELALCRRYFAAYNTSYFTHGIAPSSVYVFLRGAFSIPMRASPTGTVEASGTTYQISDDYSASHSSTTITGWGNDSWTNSQGCRVSLSGFTGLTVGRAYSGDRNATGLIFLDAEL